MKQSALRVLISIAGASLFGVITFYLIKIFGSLLQIFGVAGLLGGLIFILYFAAIFLWTGNQNDNY